MPALASIDGAQLLDYLGVAPGGAIGAYSAAGIDARETRLGAQGDIAEEFAYADGLLTDAGYDTSALTDEEFGFAVRALAYGAGYRYAQIDFSAFETHAGTNGANNAAMSAARTQVAHYFARADFFYAKLGITESKYKQQPDYSFGSIQY